MTVSQAETIGTEEVSLSWVTSRKSLAHSPCLFEGLTFLAQDLGEDFRTALDSQTSAGPCVISRTWAAGCSPFLSALGSDAR